MRRDWVMNQRANTGLLEIALEGVALGVADCEDMPHWPCPRPHKRQGQLWNVCQPLQVMPRSHAAALIPCLKMLEPDAQERGLQWIEPRVKALHFVGIFLP